VLYRGRGGEDKVAKLSKVEEPVESGIWVVGSLEREQQSESGMDDKGGRER